MPEDDIKNLTASEGNNTLGDTIAALATPPGTGAIGIIKISGEEAVSIVSRLFHSKKGRPAGSFQNFRLYLGTIIDPQTQKPLDEAMAVVMRSPHSYTGEDVVEIQLHGGYFVARRVLELVLREGALPAPPGEFTRRAFLNGRIDLTQAEAVAEIVSARSEKALEQAFRTLSGELGNQIRNWEKTLVHLQATIQADNDFPDIIEDDLETLFLNTLSEMKNELEKAIAHGEKYRRLRDGFAVVIAGTPNVGKSSLFNAIIGTDRVIVTPYAGTTRDAIEETLMLEGYPVRLIDTAGVRPVDEPIERLGVATTQRYLEEADIVILLFDATRPLQEDDISLAHKLSAKKIIPVLNKVDLPYNISKQDISQHLSLDPIETSILQKQGIDVLLQSIVTKLQEKNSSDGFSLSLNERQSAIVYRTLCRVKDSIQSLEEGYPLDCASTYLTEALSTLRSLSGNEVEEAVIESLFRNFCTGK